MDFNWYVDRRLVHEFHTSERKSFRQCRRRWDWIFRENLYPKMTPKPLDFGVAFHVAMEVYYDPKCWEFPREVMLEQAIAAFVAKTNSQRQKAIDAGVSVDEEVEKDFDDRVALGIGMLRHYVRNVAPQFDSKWKPLEVEVEFFTPIPHPHTQELMWCKCDVCWGRLCKHNGWEKLDNNGKFQRAAWEGLPVVYAGRIDMLAEDEHGDLWIVDWKTAIRIPDRHEFLDVDDQVGSYPWALWSLGMKVRGFIYHEQKKAFPVPPKRNKNVRLGRMYSVAADQNTDFETYLNTVREGDPEAYHDGKYDQILKVLEEEGMVFFHREQIHKTEYALREQGRNLGLEVLDMLSPTLAVYPNATRFGCESCAFLVPCVEKNNGGDYQFALDNLFEKRPAYYLREELSTDKKSQL